MTKTNDELQAIKDQLNELSDKLCTLSEEELKDVLGGINRDLDIVPDKSDTGTTSEDNTLPLDVSSKK